MPRAKKPKPWEAMFRRVRAVYRSEWVYPPKPNDADLDAVGDLLGIRFPESYRAFALEFGLGGFLHSLPRVYDLTRPPGHSVLDLTRHDRTFYAENPSYFDRTAPAGLVERMVVFAADSGYETFVFDPADVTDRKWHECRIYNIMRDGRVNAIADSFADWLAYVDANFRFDEEDEEEEGEAKEPAFPVVRKPDSTDPTPLNYSRFSIRKKKAPTRKEVRRLLAWNGGAVRALALAIREGQPESFGVLADALEEAGCTCEDLLASCRSGDPDIDGVWALAVLLRGERAVRRGG